ncbi:GGDEF domain-containing protein [Colwellia sp. BRX8-7]|uniref:GGDEF domain-containing protein n=1 Tax=Colwellia sp. BRX8-7 TaxID=2759833 RepID=UPI0021750C4A|nr:diguanylate cyclase [Colwellia sp. BRX8-7]
MAITSSFLKGKLSKDLLYRILLISGICSVISISIQLIIEYEYEKRILDINIEEVAHSYKDVLNLQIYDFNDPALQETLDSIVNFESISRARIKTKIDGVENTIKMESGEHPINSETFGFGLIISDGYNNFGNPILLELVANLSIAENKVVDKLFLIVFSQGIKTFIVSLFILLFIHQLVIRHIQEISNWFALYDPTSPFTPLKINPKSKKNNELDNLKISVNEMGKQIYQHASSLENIVAQRTEELEKSKSELEKLAFTDHLTGIANRNAFFKQADEELGRARRLSYELGLMMLDLDNFKSINDNYGHDAGDEVLKVISKAMNDCLRKQDTLGRIGGEEFAVIVPGTDKVGMHRLAKRLQASIELQKFSFLGKNKKVTVSIGYTKVNQNELFKSALKRADEHLYTAKNNGRNQFITDKEFVPSIVG